MAGENGGNRLNLAICSERIMVKSNGELGLGLLDSRLRGNDGLGGNDGVVGGGEA